MGALDRLIACAGHWRGTNRLQDPHTGAHEDSAASATVSPLLGGRFVRVDYTWGCPGAAAGRVPRDRLQPTELVSVGALDRQLAQRLHGHDVRRNGERERVVDVRGTYPAPPGPDWGWRTVITPGADTLQVVMHNIWPDGREELAVEDWFTRT